MTKEKYQSIRREGRVPIPKEKGVLHRVPVTGIRKDRRITREKIQPIRKGDRVPIPKEKGVLHQVPVHLHLHHRLAAAALAVKKRERGKR